MLPDGVTLSASGLLSGTATEFGSFPITITATSAAGTATQNFILTVNAPVAITSADAATFTVGTAESFPVTATGFPTPTLSVTGTLPAGVTFDSATGVLSGTPAAGSGGTYPLTFTATNGTGTPATQSFTLTVNEAPVFTSEDSATFTEGTGGAFTVTATGFPTPTLDQTATLPDGVTFDPVSGELTVDASTVAGTYTLEFTADNGIGTVSQEFTLTVTAPPPPVSLPSRLVVTGLPSGGAVVLDPDATGQYTATPTATPSPFAAADVPVRSAVGDVDGDGVADTIYITGPGVPIQFAVVSGADDETLLIEPTSPFEGSEDFTGGGFVAAADIDGDGRVEIVLTPDQGGGPRVTIFSLLPDGLTTVANFLGIDDENFRGGARPALGDVDGDGIPDLAVAAGFLGGPRVALFSGTSLLSTPERLIGDFFAFPGPDAERLRNGVYLTIGDIDGDGFADLVFAGGPGGAPRVFILSGEQVLAGDVAAAQASPLANFFVADNDADRGGVRVAVRNADGDHLADLVVGSGEGSPANVRIYLGKDFTSTTEPTTFQDVELLDGEPLTDGVFVG